MCTSTTDVFGTDEDNRTVVIHFLNAGKYPRTIAKETGLRLKEINKIRMDWLAERKKVKK